MLFADSNLRLRFDAEAGPHVVGVSFVRRFTEPEGVLQPPQSVFARPSTKCVTVMQLLKSLKSPAHSSPLVLAQLQVEKQFLFAGPLIVMPVLRKLAPSIFCQTSHISLPKTTATIRFRHALEFLSHG